MVLFIFGIIFSSLIAVLNVGDFSNNINSQKTDLQADIRRVLSWVTNDVRQTIVWDIADLSNSPNPNHIKFRVVSSWDSVNNTLVLSTNYIEYTYDSTTKILTRSSGGNTWQFNNIIASPFFTRNSSGTVVALNASDLLSSKKLIILINGQRQVKNNLNINLTLTEEVKIRNG